MNLVFLSWQVNSPFLFQALCSKLEMASFPKKKKKKKNKTDGFFQAIATTLPVFWKMKFDRSLKAYETNTSGRNSGLAIWSETIFLVTGRQRNSCPLSPVIYTLLPEQTHEAINQINENFLLPSAVKRPIWSNCNEKIIDITSLSSRAQLFVP